MNTPDPKNRKGTIEHMVEQVVRAYRGTGWWADPDDLRQEVWCAVLESQDGYTAEGAKEARPDKDDGATQAAYCRTAALRRLAKYHLRMRAPVHAGRNNLGALSGLSPEPLMLQVGPSEERSTGHSSFETIATRQLARRVDGGTVAHDPPEGLLHSARLLERVGRRLEQLAEREGVAGRRGLEALLDDASSGEHARRTRRRVREVYANKALMRRAIRRDPTMRQLAEEL